LWIRKKNVCGRRLERLSSVITYAFCATAGSGAQLVEFTVVQLMPAVLRVAVPVPLPQLFDYLPPRGSRAADIAPGSRIAVPFGRGKRVGIVIDNAAESEIETSRLKNALALLDPEPVINAELLATLQWVSKYYLHPLGEVLDTALPVGLRRIQAQPELGDVALIRTSTEDAKLRAGSMSARLIDALRGGA
jgi:primosomal protein N' (replication factor Y)